MLTPANVGGEAVVGCVPSVHDGEVIAATLPILCIMCCREASSLVSVFFRAMLSMKAPSAQAHVAFFLDVSTTDSGVEAALPNSSKRCRGILSPQDNKNVHRRQVEDDEKSDDAVLVGGITPARVDLFSPSPFKPCGGGDGKSYAVVKLGSMYEKDLVEVVGAGYLRVIMDSPLYKETAHACFGG